LQKKHQISYFFALFLVTLFTHTKLVPSYIFISEIRKCSRVKWFFRLLLSIVWAVEKNRMFLVEKIGVFNLANPFVYFAFIFSLSTFVWYVCYQVFIKIKKRSKTQLTIATSFHQLFRVNKENLHHTYNHTCYVYIHMCMYIYSCLCTLNICRFPFQPAFCYCLKIDFRYPFIRVRDLP